MNPIIKKYIYKFEQSNHYRLINKAFSPLKAFHGRVLKTNVDEVPEQIRNRNPYQVFFDWLLDVCTSGVQITLVAVIIFGERYDFLEFFMKILGFGLIIELIKMIRKAIKGEE